MRRPSPATAISVAALVIAMSGTAVAATGGTFILGRSNSATTVSSLSDSKGTALRLSSKHGTPPLTVGNSVRVPLLNASELGGIPASGFVTGPGDTTAAGTTISGVGEVALAGAPGSKIFGMCDGNSVKGAYLFIEQVNGSAVWWNFDGVSDSGASSAQVTPESALDFAVMVQVTNAATISTYAATQTYNSGTDSCSFSAQVLTTKR